MTTAKAWYLATLLMFGVAARAQAQSLVDVARQENERRSAVTWPSRIFTNADLPVVDAPPTSVTPTPPVSLPEKPAPRRDETEPSRASNDRVPCLCGADEAAVYPRHAGSKDARRVPAERTANDFLLYVQQPIVVINYMMRPRPGTESSNGNTAREQAMANYMRDAGFGAGRTPAGSR